MAKCRSCGKEIKWLKTISGKNMPVDIEPVHFLEGGKGLYVTDDGAVIHGTECPKEQTGSKKGYVSHFATCPNADAHRKEGKNDRPR